MGQMEQGLVHGQGCLRNSRLEGSGFGSRCKDPMVASLQECPRRGSTW